MKLTDTIVSHASELSDSRLQNHNVYHNLSDILIITILASICGTNSWIEIEQFGHAKKDWLKTFLKLPHGIPSHDTFSHVFSLLDTQVFEKCFMQWLNSLKIDLKKEVITGKKVSGFGKKRQQVLALDLVSVWTFPYRIMLGQVKTKDKSNETVIPKLLEMLDIRNRIVTIDSRDSQTKISKQINSQEAKYVLSLKENQKTLYKDIVSIFEQAEQNKQKQYKGILNRRKIEKVRDNERIETRRYTLISISHPFFELRWPGFRGLGKVDIVRTVAREVTKPKTRYFITNLDYEAIDDFMKVVGKLLEIEIDLHWSLDVSLNEALNLEHASYNLALVCRIALNLLKQEKTDNNEIICRRKITCNDHQYILKVLKADQSSITDEVTGLGRLKKLIKNFFSLTKRD